MIYVLSMLTIFFEMLMSKGFKPRLNIMDNQVTTHIKAFLTKNDCKLQLVEWHNHCINAAERAIQTFKDAFIAALATTDSKLTLQLWDRLTTSSRYAKSNASITH